MNSSNTIDCHLRIYPLLLLFCFNSCNFFHLLHLKPFTNFIVWINYSSTINTFLLISFGLMFNSPELDKQKYNSNQVQNMKNKLQDSSLKWLVTNSDFERIKKRTKQKNKKNKGKQCRILSQKKQLKQVNIPAPCVLQYPWRSPWPSIHQPLDQLGQNFHVPKLPQ